MQKYYPDTDRLYYDSYQERHHWKASLLPPTPTKRRSTRVEDTVVGADDGYCTLSSLSHSQIYDTPRKTTCDPPQKHRYGNESPVSCYQSYDTTSPVPHQQRCGRESPVSYHQRCGTESPNSQILRHNVGSYRASDIQRCDDMHRSRDYRYESEVPFWYRERSDMDNNRLTNSHRCPSPHEHNPRRQSNLDSDRQFQIRSLSNHQIYHPICPKREVSDSDDDCLYNQWQDVPTQSSPRNSCCDSRRRCQIYDSHNSHRIHDCTPIKRSSPLRRCMTERKHVSEFDHDQPLQRHRSNTCVKSRKRLNFQEPYSLHHDRSARSGARRNLHQELEALDRSVSESSDIYSHQMSDARLKSYIPISASTYGSNNNDRYRSEPCLVSPSLTTADFKQRDHGGRKKDQCYNHTPLTTNYSCHSDADTSASSSESDDETHADSESAKPSCKCTELQRGMLRMATSAYSNIRRKAASPESFAQFKTELDLTNQFLQQTVDMLKKIKGICGHD